MYLPIDIPCPECEYALLMHDTQDHSSNNQIKDDKDHYESR